MSQQLRWARSVLDIKFWIHPAIAGKLSFREITASFFHGFYYLQGATTLVILLAAAYMLASGTTPQAVNYFVSPSFAFLTGSLLLCDLFRQRFIWIVRVNGAFIGEQAFFNSPNGHTSFWPLSR